MQISTRVSRDMVLRAYSSQIVNNKKTRNDDGQGEDQVRTGGSGRDVTKHTQKKTRDDVRKRGASTKAIRCNSNKKDEERERKRATDRLPTTKRTTRKNDDEKMEITTAHHLLREQ